MTDHNSKPATTSHIHHVLTPEQEASMPQVDYSFGPSRTPIYFRGEQLPWCPTCGEAVWPGPFLHGCAPIDTTSYLLEESWPASTDNPESLYWTLRSAYREGVAVRLDCGGGLEVTFHIDELSATQETPAE